MTKSYVKACYIENWDKHQLKVVQMFGNKPFFEFLKQYGIQQAKIQQKYKTVAVKYYRDKINFEVLGGITAEFARRPVPTLSEGKLNKKLAKKQ